MFVYGFQEEHTRCFTTSRAQTQPGRLGNPEPARHAELAPRSVVNHRKHFASKYNNKTKEIIFIIKI